MHSARQRNTKKKCNSLRSLEAKTKTTKKNEGSRGLERERESHQYKSLFDDASCRKDRTFGNSGEKLQCRPLVFLPYYLAPGCSKVQSCCSRHVFPLCGHRPSSRTQSSILAVLWSPHYCATLRRIPLIWLFCCLFSGGFRAFVSNVHAFPSYRNRRAMPNSPQVCQPYFFGRE